MKLLIYFLIIVNAAFLFWNWDTISGVATGKPVSQTLAGETLVLKGDKQIPAVQNRQDRPPPAATQVTEIISIVIDFLADAWEFAKDIFADAPQELPEAPPPPPPAPVKPQSSKCYQLTGYATSAAALNDRAILETYRISAKMVGGETPESQRNYRISAKVRTNLDTAKNLSDLLAGAGVPNSIKEDAPLGFLLVSQVYSSRSQAERAHAKVKKLGFSSSIRDVSGKPATYKSYDLLIDQSGVETWDASRRNLLTLLSDKVKVKEIPRC